MISSMTGFGTGRTAREGWVGDVTVRTVNHRHLSVHVRSLRDRPDLQIRVEESVREAFRRGEVEVWITLQRDAGYKEPLRFDRKAIEEGFAELSQIASELSMESPPTLGDLIAIGAFEEAEDAALDPWPAVSPALRAALADAQAARKAEGEVLAKELGGLLEGLSRFLTQVEDRLPQVIEGLRERLQERIDSLDLQLDPTRLEAEVALLADRFDVQEEMTRLKGHIERSRSLLGGEGAVGRKLGFLGQEMLREANTLGAKSRDLEISSLVVDMKTAIERFKEQAQNVE